MQVFVWSLPGFQDGLAEVFKRAVRTLIREAGARGSKN